MTPRFLTLTERAEIHKRREAASRMVSDLCHKRREWVMSIPCRDDYDPDLVIGASLRDVAHLLNSCSELERQLADVKQKLDQVDDVLVVNWCGPRVDGDYHKALADLVTWNIQIHDDPAVSEEAAERKDHLESLERRLKEAQVALSGRTVSCICGGEAQADKERLDWLEQCANGIAEITHGYEGPWVIWRTDQVIRGHGKSLRQAIDVERCALHSEGHQE